MPGKNAADMEKIFLREKLFSSSGMNRDALCFVGTYYIRGEEGRTVVVSIPMIVPWGAAQVQAITESRSALERKGFSFHPERDSFRFTRREQALFRHA